MPCYHADIRKVETTLAAISLLETAIKQSLAGIIKLCALKSRRYIWIYVQLCNDLIALKTHLPSPAKFISSDFRRRAILKEGVGTITGITMEVPSIVTTKSAHDRDLEIASTKHE